MKRFIIILIPVLFIACNQDTVEKTRELNRNNKMLKVVKVKEEAKDTKQERILKLNNQKTLELEKIKDTRTKELAKIEAQKEQKLKEIEANTKKEQLATELKKANIESNKSITLAKINTKSKVELKEKETSFYKVATIILALILIVWIIIRYLTVLSKKRIEAELKEKEQAHEAYLQELKLKHENINKMLEIISDEKSDKEIKKAITKLLERGKNNILEYKK